MATSSSSSAPTISSSGPEMPNLTMHDLETITNQFSDKNRVGEGGYGVVYKGEYNGYEIAVKKLFVSNDLQEKAFKNEFEQLKKVRHENVIRLIAYCKNYRHTTIEIDGENLPSAVIDRALCFEYMPQGSLANHISEESCIHGWATTYKIIRGTCEGLHYLHKGRGEGAYIYHLDLKPANIVLDKDMTPKIADFGLSRLFRGSKTYETCSATKGTRGFMPPEYIHNGTISPKNDVFSLGVIIFYLLAGKIGYGDYCDTRPSRKTLIEKVQEYWRKKMGAEVLRYRWDQIDLLGVKICIELAMACVETDRAKRPSTEGIIDELQKLDFQIKKMSREKLQGISGGILTTLQLTGSAALTASQNKQRCIQLANRAKNLGAILPSLSYMATKDAENAPLLERLKGVKEALEEALRVIQACQSGGVFSKYSRSKGAELDDVDKRINKCSMDVAVITTVNSCMLIKAVQAAAYYHQGQGGASSAHGGWAPPPSPAPNFYEYGAEEKLADS